MKKSISRVINMIEDVSSVVLSTKTPDDGPTIIVTDHVLVRTQRHWTKSIGNESLFLRNGEVRVAHPDQLFGDNNQTIPEVIDSVVCKLNSMKTKLLYYTICFAGDNRNTNSKKTFYLTN